MPDFIKSNYFLAYIFKRMRDTSAFDVITRTVRYSRRFLLIGRIVRYIGTAVTVIETSAVLIIVTAAAVAMIPLMLIALAVFALIDRRVGGRLLKSADFADYLSRERICVIAEAGRFGKALADDLAGRGYAVFVVTYDPVYRFVSAHRYGEVYYVRHAFFFRLKRTRLKFSDDKLIYLM